MKASCRLSAVVVALLIVFHSASGQSSDKVNIAERHGAPTVLGGTGLFNTFSTRTLCKGEFTVGMFWNNFDRDPGDLDINQIPFNFTIGVIKRLEVWANWMTWQETTSRSPLLLSGYHYNAVRLFGDPVQVLGPVAGERHGTASFSGTGAKGGGILPSLGHFGRVQNFRFGNPFSPSGPAGIFVDDLGLLLITDLPSFYNDLPFFGETEFRGFQESPFDVHALLEERTSSNGSGDLYVGSKRTLVDPNKGWFSLALAGYLKIPISRTDDARARGLTSGEFEGGPVVILGQESGRKRVLLYENVGYVHTGDIEKRGLKVLDLRDKVLLDVGASLAISRDFEIISELAGTVMVGGGTPSVNRVHPLDLNVGLRYFSRDGRYSFGGAFRRFLTDADTRAFNSLKINCIDQCDLPRLEFPEVLFPPKGDANGFTAQFSVHGPRPCQPLPVTNVQIEASSERVKRGEPMTLTVRHWTPGYVEDRINSELQWEVGDERGIPLLSSKGGRSIRISTAGLAPGKYTATVRIMIEPRSGSACGGSEQVRSTMAFEVLE